MPKPWTDLLDAKDLLKLAEQHKFVDKKKLAYLLSEAAWGYRRRAESVNSRPDHQQQKHFLKILKNRAARRDLSGWRSEMTFYDAINLGIAGLSGFDADNDPSTLHLVATKALRRLRGERGGAPRDLARDYWFRSLIIIYESGARKKAATSVSVTPEGEDHPGPFLRFVTDACLIAKIDFDPLAKRSTLKRLIKGARALRVKNRRAIPSLDQKK